METLIDSALAKNVLLDGPIDAQIIEGIIIAGGSGLPFGGWDDLNKLKKREKRPQSELE